MDTLENNRPQQSLKQVALSVIGIGAVMSMPFALWGFAYEYSYFKVLGLSCSDYLGYFHYVVTASTTLILVFATILLISMAGKFFGENIERDDWAHVTSTWKEIPFSWHISLARMITVCAVLYWLVVYIEPYWTWSSKYLHLGNAYTFVLFFVTVQFVSSFYMSQRPAKLPILLMYLVAICACFSAGGIEVARQDFRKLSETTDANSQVVLRDDKYIKVKRIEGHLEVTAPSVIPSDLWKVGFGLMK